MPEGVSLVNLLLILLCIVLSAFFSGSEAAFLSAQRVKISHMVNTGVKGAERASRLMEHPERLLPTLLLGNNVVNTAAAALGTAVAIALIRDSGVAVLAATVVVTVVLLVLGETVPKTIAYYHAERVALVLARPVEMVERLLFPLATILQGVSQGVARLFGGRSAPTLVTAEEIKTLIAVGRDVGTVHMHEADLLERVFRFGDRRVGEIMTPRTEVVWIEKGTILREFLDTYIQYRHTRFPVVEGGPDNVIGILSAKDVLQAMARGELSNDSPVTKSLRQAFFVPETKSVRELFKELQQSRSPMAVVVDEFGGTAGLVTLKQLLEEIVGRVREEAEMEEYRTLDERTVQLDGGMRIEEANERLGLGLPEGEYETVAGFVLHSLGHIPREGESLEHGNLHFIVTHMRGVKIERVMVVKGPSTGQRAGL